MKKLLLYSLSVASIALFNLSPPIVAQSSLSADSVNTVSNEFEWREVPDLAVLHPRRPFLSDRFKWVSSSENEIRVRFTGSKTPPNPGDKREECRFVVVTPPSGIESASLEYKERIFLKDGAPVQLDIRPPATPINSRIQFRRVGELRGAELIQVEYKPSIGSSARGAADTDWIPDATLVLQLGGPIQPRRSLPPLLSRPLESIVINPNDIDRCLPPLNQNPYPDSPRLKLWRSPSLKVSIRREGWYTIPAERLLTEWGNNLRVEELGLYSRGALLSPPKELRVPNDPTPDADTLETLFVFDSRGAIRVSGNLSVDDRLLFHAEASQEAYDPIRVYWLIRNEDSRITLSESAIAAATDIRPATLARRKYSIGEDKEFVPGGLQNESQNYFWVDGPFPQEATKSLDFGLPDWTFGPSGGAHGRIVVVFPSASDRSYVPAGALVDKNIGLEIDGKKVASVLNKGESGFNSVIEFEIPKDIREPTLSLVYHPPDKRSERPFLDRFELAATQPMVWAGTDCSYELFPSASNDYSAYVQIDRDRSGSLVPPGYAFGRLREGSWVSLKKESEAPLVYSAPGPMVEVSFLKELEGESVEALDSFTWPQWYDSPPETDQIVLSPKVFAEHLTHIRRINQENGFKCDWIDLDEVFDLFSGGQFSPFAVRNFLSWISKSWPDPQPASVLLVGDTSWDAWRRFPEGGQIPNWTPSYHDIQAPDFPSDLWFVTGEPKDSVADWLWGRIPCQTVGHLEGYLAKRYNFEERPKTGWSNRLLWVSDDNSPTEEHIQEIFRGTFPQAMRLDHIRIRDYPFVDNFYYGPSLPRIQEEARNDRAPLDYGKISPACNLAIRTALSAGASLFVYYGHSGPNVLAHERALFGGGSVYSDVPFLRNEGKAPFAFLMTCDVGRFDYARTPAKWSVGLAEELLFHPGGGCLALVASSGKGLPSDHKLLLGRCLDALFNQGLPTCGEILWSGKTQCLTPPGRNLSVDMFTLFGDPLFIPPTPKKRFNVRPLTIKWNREGALLMKIGIPDDLGAGEVHCWMVGDDLVERWSNDAVTVSEEGELEITLPNARDLRNLLMACEVPSNPDRDAAPNVGAFGLDLLVGGKPNWSANVQGGTPNLVLRDEDVSLSNYSVREGETLFIEASVRNEGKGAAENVAVRAFDARSGAKVESFAEYPASDVSLLLPGEAKTVRIRSDRWSGTGEFDFRVKVDPENAIEESDEADNEAIKTIRVYAKPDLAWGLVRGSTSGAIDWNRAKSIDASWVKDPTNADLDQWSPLRETLAEVDRGLLLLAPITNFGESESATCTLRFTYHFESNKPPRVLPPMKIPPGAPSLDGKIVGRPVPVLILPGMKKIEIEIDPEHLLDESDMENNILSFSPPPGLWDRFPILAPKRKPPSALRGK